MDSRVTSSKFSELGTSSLTRVAQDASQGLVDKYKIQFIAAKDRRATTPKSESIKDSDSELTSQEAFDNYSNITTTEDSRATTPKLESADDSEISTLKGVARDKSQEPIEKHRSVPGICTNRRAQSPKSESLDDSDLEVSASGFVKDTSPGPADGYSDITTNYGRATTPKSNLIEDSDSEVAVLNGVARDTPHGLVAKYSNITTVNLRATTPESESAEDSANSEASALDVAIDISQEPVDEYYRIGAIFISWATLVLRCTSTVRNIHMLLPQPR